MFSQVQMPRVTALSVCLRLGRPHAPPPSQTFRSGFPKAAGHVWAAPAVQDAVNDTRLTLNPMREPSSPGCFICSSLSNADVPSLPGRLSKLPVLTNGRSRWQECVAGLDKLHFHLRKTALLMQIHCAKSIKC